MFKAIYFYAGAPSGAPIHVQLKAYLQNMLIVMAVTLATPSLADNIYQTPENFVNESFGGKPPEAEVIWLQDELKKNIEKILDHSYAGQRVRYWQQENRSVWILEEIGKTKPITVGFIINQQKIERVNVLVFRESRGWEIKYPFFTNQFSQLQLTGDHKLDKNIDGISGATLSVRALSKLARIALLLDQHIQNP